MEKSKSLFLDRLQAKIDSGEIVSARQADEMVSELLAESEFSVESDQYDDLSASLCDISGKEFPGDWGNEGGEKCSP
jgi:hypothetical protein